MDVVDDLDLDLDLDAYAAADFDAKRHVDRVLFPPRERHRRRRGCTTLEEEEAEEEEGVERIKAWERRLDVAHERTARSLEPCWKDVRARLPRAAREARRVAELAREHAAQARGEARMDAPSHPLRRATRRTARVRRVLRTLDAVQALHVHVHVEEDDEGDDVATWMRATRRAKALRRALRATKDVEGYEGARDEAEEHVRRWLLRGEGLAKHAAAMQRHDDVRRLLRGARRCGDEGVVRKAVVHVLGARVARRVVQAFDDEEEGGDAHVRAWKAWQKACAEEGGAWRKDVASHAWDEAARVRTELARPADAQATRDAMRERRVALADAVRSLVHVDDPRRPDPTPPTPEEEEEEESEEEEEEEEDAEGGEASGGEGVDAETLAWKASAPWRRTAAAWRTSAWTHAQEGGAGDRRPDGTTVDLRASTRRMEAQWTRWATAWWHQAEERCACATDLADADGLAQMAHRIACELATQQIQVAQAWTDGQAPTKRNAREDATDLLRMAACACACACDVQKRCARVLELVPPLDQDAALVREDGTLDVAQLWRRATAEDPAETTAPDAGDPATAKDAEGRLLDAVRATEAAFVSAVGHAAVTRLAEACAAPYQGRDERGRDGPAASRDHKGGVGNATRPGLEVSWPTFSASPQECVASAGEDLLRVPERIAEVDACVGHYREVKAILRAAAEGAEDEEEPDDGAEMDETERMVLPWLAEATASIDPTSRVEEGEGGVLVASWSARVAQHVAQKYAEALLQGIRRLDAEGEAQLQADLEYFLNVIAALAAEAPSSLVTLRDCVSVEPERLQELALTASAPTDVHGTPVDRDAVRVLLRAKQRGQASAQ